MKCASTKLLWVAVLLPCLNVSAQVFEDNDPVNYYYRKISFADFPVVSQNRVGTIFYHVEKRYFDNYIHPLIVMDYEKIRKYTDVFHFKKKKFRYKSYSISIQSTQFTNPNLKSIRSLSSIVIEADRYKRRWSWKKFKTVLIYVERVKVYTGTVDLVINLKPDPVPNSLVLQTSIDNINYTFENSLNGAISKLCTSGAKPGMGFNLDDGLIRQRNIGSKIKLIDNYLKYDEVIDEFVLYMPVVNIL